MSDIVRTTLDCECKVIFRQMTSEEKTAEIEHFREKSERDELSAIRYAYEQGYRESFEEVFKEKFGISIDELDSIKRNRIEQFYKEDFEQSFKEQLENGLVERCKEKGKKRVDEMRESGLTEEQIWKILRED